MKKKFWSYYENGKKEKFTLKELVEYFDGDIALEEQKKQGTDFYSWLREMEHMQILIPEGY